VILILDDHPLARQGLSSLLQLYRKDDKILHAGAIRDAASMMEANDVELVFVDLNLGKENGFSFINWLKENETSAKIFVITSSSRQCDFRLAQELGVDAYVLKDAFIDEIVYGLKTIERGGKFYSATLLESLKKNTEEEKELESLTEREIEVLLLLSRGYSNADISTTLYIAEGTVKKHINSILSKFQFKNRVEAVIFANTNSYSIQLALNKGIRPDLRKKEITV
jgi:two-component system nitrate/nitrite response regulator NarL/two-component system nitrate/nitrite response regulator NarP